MTVSSELAHTLVERNQVAVYLDAEKAVVAAEETRVVTPRQTRTGRSKR